MTKVSRTFRIDQKLSTALDKLYTRHGDNTFHIEQALSQYGPIKALDKPVAKVKSPSKADGKPIDDNHWEYIWDLYGKKGNHKTSKARYSKLSGKDRVALTENLPAYIQSTPDKQYRKNFETYINQECWNDEVITNDQANRPNQSGSGHKLSVVERTRLANQERERARQARTGNGQVMGEATGNLRPPAQQPVRSDNPRELGETLDGSFTRTD